MPLALLSLLCYFSHLEIRKVLSKLAKEKGCEVLADWIKPCENHVFWSASTTFSGDGRIIWAKFKTFMSHIINKHSSLDDPLFNRCGHDKIHPRKWLHAGMLLYIEKSFVLVFYSKQHEILNNFLIIFGILIGKNNIIIMFGLWLLGSVAFEKLCTALTNNSLVKGIKQASPFAQTSCLEGFHSLLNQYAPKMILYIRMLECIAGKLKYFW